MGGKDSDESDDDSAENLKRTEGLDAQAFSAPLGTHAAAAPPKYIRVYRHVGVTHSRYDPIIRSRKISTIYFSLRSCIVRPMLGLPNLRPLGMGPQVLQQMVQAPFRDTRLVRYGL